MLRKQQVDLERAELTRRMMQRPAVSCCNAPPQGQLDGTGEIRRKEAREIRRA